jgi:tRNA threonylcarbamoyl adenosine modification protein (Sua5/YciO/YrdC/YwlC family)
MLIEINPYNIDQRLIQQIVKSLKDGGIIIFPTDTVYALGCDLTSKKGLQELARLKGMKLNKAHFSIVCKDFSDISNYVKPISRPIFKLLKQNLPGPFTFILPATNEVSKIFDTSKKEIGIRIPNNQIILSVVEALGNPVAVTSLINEEDEIQEYFADPYAIYERYEGKVDYILDGGYGNLDASTIVNCSGDEPEIIRQGIGILNE